ncbi:SurA N-terminal domain-containing protein [Pelagibacterium sp. H642]|uniref:peptidylprolyl isomerase n=1 Tax=Pelagibacterium sp. H642 TaxID=1881069 RepID=UPI002814FDAB|nr:SurA N-terminal domain-containing protein [Pelagibacterium sp. H642]WMT90475.1 SurA N-terminal domain-containing protein [Pelagibacterium sp. H642]
MLDNLRNFGRSWIAKILLGVLIIAVAGFGIPSVFLDLNANTVARVGDQNISVRDFDQVYRSQLNQFAAQTGMAPTAQQAVSYGLPNAAIARLANDASIEILARDLGLGASDRKLVELVRQDPSFASAMGLFDTGEFTNMLRNSGLTEAEYLNLQRRAASREQVGMIFNGAYVPQVALDIARSYDNDQRTIEYVELNPVLFEVTEEPSEEELARFFEENQTRFRTVETRHVSLLPLTAEALAAGVEVTEEEIAAEYERTAGQYVSPERRTVHQLTLPDAEAAQAFAEGIEAGASFASVVSQTGMQTEVTELGTFAQGEITDAAVAQATFGLEENGYAVIEGAEGQRAIWVSSIQEEGQAPLEDVRGELEQALRLEKAQDLLLTAYDEIEEARAAFLPIEDVAERYGLEVYDLALTADGAALAEIETLPQGSTQTIVDAVFAASADTRVTPAINLGSNRTVFFSVEEIEPARDQTLDEVRAEVITAWQDLQTDMAMTRAAEDMVAAIDSGSDLFTVAAENGQTPQTSSPFTRNTASAGLDPQVAQAAFQGGEGHAGYVPTQNGGMVVFQVTQVTPASADATSQVAEAMETSFADLIFASFVEGLRQDLGVRINQEALNRVIGLQ